MSTPAETILTFVELAVQRRKRALQGEDRAKIEALDEHLRDLIDGARPAPKNIEGRAAPAAPQPTPVSKPSQPVQPSQPAQPSQPVRATTPTPPVQTPPAAPRPPQPPQPPQSKGQNVKALAEKLELSQTDKKKLTEIDAADLPVSQYTPSAAPAYLSDYYTDDIVYGATIDLKLSGMVRADSGDLDVPKEVKVLFGLEKPAPPAAVRVPTGDVSSVTDAKKRIVAPGAAARMAAQSGVMPAPQPAPARVKLDAESDANKKPVIVHMLAGGTKRGAIEVFEPATGAIDFLEDNGGNARIELADVLAVFFVQKKGEDPSVPSGQRVIVKLVNDRQVAGLTEDYAEGGDALTLTPEQRRGNVDRVWIPAWAVKEIHLG